MITVCGKGEKQSGKDTRNVGKYFYKEKMKIVNAAMVKHKGNPASLQMTRNKLNQTKLCIRNRTAQ